MNFITETILAQWKLSFNTIKLFKLILSKSMKKGKVNTWRRIQLSICRWAKCGGYFQILSTDRQLRFLSSPAPWPVLTPMIPSLNKKLINLEQVANFLLLCKQNYIYPCGVIATSNGCHSYYCSAISFEYFNTPFHFVEHNLHSFNAFYCNAFKIISRYEKNSSKTV
jgi:hypothetical protein